MKLELIVRRGVSRLARRMISMRGLRARYPIFRSWRRSASALLLVSLCEATVPSAVAAQTIGPNWISGDIAEITSTTDGFLIGFKGYKLPASCPDQQGWLLIAKEDQTMISVVLAYWMNGKRSFTIYVNGVTSGYCRVNQADPLE